MNVSKLCYISPSLLPSRSANSVHVLHQCNALASVEVDVTLFAQRGVKSKKALFEKVLQSYGLDASALDLRTFHSPTLRASTLQIALFAVAQILRLAGDVKILSRNLYGAFILAILFNKSLVYEVHDIETGFRGAMQRRVLLHPRVKLVAISQKLIEHLNRRFDVSVADKTAVLHDAAPAGIVPLSPDRRRAELETILGQNLSEWQKVCGYFGQLLPGRGIELIQKLAERRPDCLFLLYGGDQELVAHLDATNSLQNMRFSGHVPHQEARRLMQATDILLMPYQHQVSIGLVGHDTAQWMSPMKLFEYMATGVPIISSDLPVLREVLEDGRNSMLVPPDDPDAWATSVAKLIDDPSLGQRIGEAAHCDYAQHHTWTHRAQKMLAMFETP